MSSYIRYKSLLMMESFRHDLAYKAISNALTGDLGWVRWTGIRERRALLSANDLQQKQREHVRWVSILNE